MLQQLVAFLFSVRDAKGMLLALVASLGLKPAPARGRGTKKPGSRGS